MPLIECLPCAKVFAERMIIAECRKGEEITHTYNMDNERNDYAALNYFFLQRLDPPRLCSIDLPEGHLDASFPEFDDHYLPRDKAAILVRSFTSRHSRERMQRQISIIGVWSGAWLSAHHLLKYLSW